MINIRKIIPLVLGVVLITGSVVTSYASESMTTEDKARALYDLELFNGVHYAEFQPDLESLANREQATKMLVVALDYKLNEASSEYFSDVSGWAQPYVSLAVVNGITDGITTDDGGSRVYGGHEIITDRQIQGWFDRVITGAATMWEGTTTLDDESCITRGQLVDRTYEALKRTPVGASETLIETIIGDNSEQRTIAIAGGLIEADYEVDMEIVGVMPDIEMIEVISQHEITVLFEGNLDEASAVDEDNYRIHDGMNQRYLIDEIHLTDVNEITMSFQENLRGVFRLEVIEVTSEGASNKITDCEVFKVERSSDVEAPIIKKFQIESHDEIVIIFSGQLKATTAERKNNYTLFDVHGDEVLNSIVEVELIREDRVMISFNAALDGYYTIEIDGVQDTDGNEIFEALAFEVDVSSGLYIDKIDIYSKNFIQINFTDEIDKASSEDYDNYKLLDEDFNEIEDFIDDLSWQGDEVNIRLKEELVDGDYTIEVDGVEDDYGQVIDEKITFKIAW